jgi:hypothetical protein
MPITRAINHRTVTVVAVEIAGMTGPAVRTNLATEDVPTKTKMTGDQPVNARLKPQIKDRRKPQVNAISEATIAGDSNDATTLRRVLTLNRRPSRLIFFRRNARSPRLSSKSSWGMLHTRYSG